jgi:hypothetical protein
VSANPKKRKAEEAGIGSEERGEPPKKMLKGNSGEPEIRQKLRSSKTPAKECEGSELTNSIPVKQVDPVIQ